MSSNWPTGAKLPERLVKTSEPARELLLRYLDNRVTGREREQVLEGLRIKAETRAFLREVAEQSVLVADLERATQERKAPFALRAAEQDPVLSRPHRRWAWALAGALVGVCALLVWPWFSATRLEVARVSKVAGASRLFGSQGEIDHSLRVGAWLRIGDTIETRSCDAWIELDLKNGGKMTVAGNSSLRILEEESKRTRLKLLRGSLWISPTSSRTASSASLFIQTPATELKAGRAQFDVQTSATETMVRVNEGSVRLRQSLDGSTAEIPAGHQAATSLARGGPIQVTAQPKPVNYWACNLGKIPEVILGRWLPPTSAGAARLGAEPLLWPIPNREPLLLHAVALSVLRTSELPVRLEAGSRLLFRGRTERAQSVRFGFSTQKMHGVFSGKFEADVRPESLGPAGLTWEVSLSLSDFRPLQPNLSSVPDGLELNDVYALTVVEDARLEINHIELVPPK